MMEYITFMHKTKDPGATGGTEEEWDRFIDVAKESGLFRGGSAIGQRMTIGNNGVPDITDHIGGYMRFDADNLDELTDLLKQHPTVVHGGTVEICEMPKS
jgi:hypothetical protein